MLKSFEIAKKLGFLRVADEAPMPPGEAPKAPAKPDPALPTDASLSDPNQPDPSAAPDPNAQPMDLPPDPISPEIPAETSSPDDAKIQRLKMVLLEMVGYEDEMPKKEDHSVLTRLLSGEPGQPSQPKQNAQTALTSGAPAFSPAPPLSKAPAPQPNQPALP